MKSEIVNTFDKSVKPYLRKIQKEYIKILCKYQPIHASKVMYKKFFKKKLNLKSPKEFNEKLMWLKINKYTNNDLVTKCADKYLVRDYVIECGLGFLLNDLIDVFDSADSINWNELPNKFVLKCNHGAGYNIICSDKSKLNIDETVQLLEKYMNENYAQKFAETQYKNIVRKIVCEKYLDPKEGEESIADFKLHCFNGKCELILHCRNRGENTKYHFFDNDWNLMKINPYYGNKDDADLSTKPKNIEQLIEYAEKLAKPFPFVRVDFYDVDKIIFGELTFTPSACLDTDYTPEALEWMGSMINIDNK